jgi:hypothetical protein
VEIKENATTGLTNNLKTKQQQKITSSNDTTWQTAGFICQSSLLFEIR